MAEENKNIKVNIIKKAAAPEVAKKAVEEVVEKKKVVVKLKTPVKHENLKEAAARKLTCRGFLVFEIYSD